MRKIKKEFDDLRIEEVSELARRFTNLTDDEKKSFLSRIHRESQRLIKGSVNRSKMKF